MPEFFTEYVDFRIEPTWHEFEALEYTGEVADADISLEEFMDVIGKTSYIADKRVSTKTKD